jgi:hypothetical protein
VRFLCFILRNFDDLAVNTHFVHFGFPFGCWLRRFNASLLKLRCQASNEKKPPFGGLLNSGFRR